MSLRRKRDYSSFDKEECDRIAFDKVTRSVSICEQSTAKMRKKLQESGLPDDSIEDALQKAVRIGAIDDKRYAECLIRSTLASGKGLKFALKEVESLGIDPYELDSYNEYLDEGDDAVIERAIDFLTRHPSRSKDVRGAAYRKLVTKGYDHSVASTASRLYAEGLS